MSLPPFPAERTQLEDSAVEAYRAAYGTAPAVVASAPGRVNLIGEHTDYNDGFVLPAAIHRAVAVAAGPGPRGRLAMRAADVQGRAEVRLDRPAGAPRRGWSTYVVGVARLLQERAAAPPGARVLVAGNVPRGAGLSSSAALEVACATALLALAHRELPPLDIIRLCQRAEHEFVGVRCGIMDQFISMLGRKDHALRIDCRSLQFEPVPLPAGLRVLVCDTGVRRALASSEYNRRRDECAAGVRALSTALGGIAALRDVSPADLRRHEGLLDGVVLKRCRHVVHENRRVLDAVAALRAGDLPAFGRLLFESHASLRDDYQVSCPELDAVVDICAAVGGVVGARMTGAGFGGSAICVLREEAVGAAAERLRAEYPARTGRTPALHVCTLEDGATVRHV